MVKDPAVCVGSGFWLIGALLYFAGGITGLAACLSAALAHELGHLAALLLCGGRVQRIRLTAAGFILDCGGLLSPGTEALVLAAGPFAGLLFALFCLGLPGRFFLYAGATAMMGSFFNLLPIPPLDGGRLGELALLTVMPERTALRILRVFGVLLSLLVAVAGIRLSVYAVTAAGIWLSVLASGLHFW